MQIDVLASNEQVVVFSKLGRLIVIGFVQPAEHQWRGWKIHVRKGSLPVQTFRMPWPMLRFMADSANDYWNSYEQMSPRQQELAGSGAAQSMAEQDEAFVAFQADVALSGSAAFRGASSRRA
jgi:hypothetical protein